MNDPIGLLVAERVLERGIVSIFAGISMILGYSLFRAGIVIQQQGEGEWGKLKIKLLSVGPGVFFALFGTIVMIVLVMNGLKIPNGTALSSMSAPEGGSEPGSTATQPSVTYDMNAGEIALSSIAPEDEKAITTVIDVIQGRDAKLGLTDAEMDAFQRGLNGLEQLRKAGAFRRFPRIAAKYDDWSARASMNPRFLNTLNAEDRKDFQDMRAFLKDSYLSGGTP